MTPDEFRSSLAQSAPHCSLTPSLAALWWDAKGDWEKAHSLIDNLSDKDAMAVHAYLHRKEGDTSNANYWYARAGNSHRRTTFEEEWASLVGALLPLEDSAG